MGQLRKFISKKDYLTDLNNPISGKSHKPRVMYTVMHDGGELWLETNLYPIPDHASNYFLAPKL